MPVSGYTFSICDLNLKSCVENRSYTRLLSELFGICLYSPSLQLFPISEHLLSICHSDISH